MKNKDDRYEGSVNEACDKAIHDPDPSLHNRKWDEMMAEIYAEEDAMPIARSFEDYIELSMSPVRDEKIYIQAFEGWFYKGKFYKERPE